MAEEIINPYLLPSTYGGVGNSNLVDFSSTYGGDAGYNFGAPGNPDLTGAASGSWMDSLGGFKGIQGMLGAGQLGLGFLGYLDNKKTAAKQRELLGQQIDTNQFLLGQAKGRQGDIAKAFGGGSAPQGLAANQVNKVL